MMSDGEKFETLLPKNAEYQSRKKSVEDGEENKKKELDREIKRIDIDLRLLNTRKLYEVLTDENNVWQLDVPFTDVTSNPAFDLLKYLIWNGYIDEEFSGTEENRVILDYFKKQEWISSYQKLTDGRYQAFSTQKKLIEA